jgi:hypothetical protein
MTFPLPTMTSCLLTILLAKECTTHSHQNELRFLWLTPMLALPHGFAQEHLSPASGPSEVTSHGWLSSIFQAQSQEPEKPFELIKFC